MFKQLSAYLLVFLMFVMTGCSNSSDSALSGQKDTDGILKLRLSGEPTYLNPILYTDAYSGTVVDFVFNGLFKV
ncbi:MAG: hypothetical protein HRT90_09215, partial [Candidatus Margulisbacteria bacterium]|nr:hypothetical protein [Candidatus Margulisiibacteriota bacterium]